MKKLFTAVRHSDIDTVKQLLLGKPELVNCVAKQPPKKDDGQSPLQVALKTGNIEIADLLIDSGANLNFMEDAATCCNAWRAPVIHDAINCAVMCSRWNAKDYMANLKAKDGTIKYETHSTKENADNAYYILRKMIEKGADVNSIDSYGSSGLNRFCAQASQILPAYNYVENRISDDRLFTDEIREDLTRILVLLRDSGANKSYVSKNIGKPVMEFYCKGCLYELLKCVF